MVTWLIHFWERLRSNYWLLPTLMLIAAIVLSYGMLEADSVIHLSRYRGFRWLIFSSSEGARAVLSTIAASTFAAATLAFSVTMVTLSLTSSQFGPRLLRNFLRDPFNQFTFGAFIATFIYCLLIMRGMVIAENETPNLSISLAVVMVVTDAVLFIGFIHHLTSSIRVEHIASEIGGEFIDAINRFLPESYQTTTNENGAGIKKPGEQPSIIRSNKSGYVQAVNYPALVSLAERDSITIKLLFRPGHYIVTGAPLAEVWPSVHLQDHINDPIRSCFLLGKEPTNEQDLEFTIRQLVQVAARALSPGINDPFTAMTIIDYLSAGLALVTTRELPEYQIYDERGRLLLIKYQITFQGLCEASFNVIRQNSCDNPPVVLYLLEMLMQLASIAQRSDDREAIGLTAKLSYKSAIGLCQLDYDRQAIEQRYDQINRILKTSAYRPEE